MVTNHQGSGEPLQANTVSPRIFKFLKRYVDKLLPHERIVVLSFNEFAFRDYVPMNQEGYNSGEKLPSHLIVPCIRFVVSKKFHFLGSLFFHTEFLTTKPDKFSKDMSECIKLYILALENINLKVIATVCPLSAVFHQAVEILTQVPYMEEFDGPLIYSIGRNEEIIHLHDPKYIRDSFIRWFMLFDLEFTLNGKQFEASRYDITDVLELDNKPPLLQKAYNNSKYYDQISYYYFNEKISVTIRRLIKQGFLSTQAIGTSLFINMFRQIFNRIYGLHDEDCDNFDFQRMNEYIEFVKSIHATQSPHEENYRQEVASSLPSTSSYPSQSNLGVTALEKFVRDTPATYEYPHTEKALDFLKQDNMYEPITVTSASSKNIPIAAPLPSKKGSKSKKKKNKKDKKKYNQNCGPPLQTNQVNEIKRDETNTKDDLLLLYQNPPQDIPDNGEFLLCTTEKYQEMQSNNAISSDHTYAYNNADNEGFDKNFWLYAIFKSESESGNHQEEMNLVPNNKVQQKYGKKVLSPVQNRPDINFNKNTDQNTVQNSNLNENIRKYKNVNRNNSSAVRKIDLEDESNKENITKSYLSTISEDILNFNTQKIQTLNLDEEITEISYSISDPDDSTEYQFEQICNKIDDISESTTDPTIEVPEMSITPENEFLSKETIDILEKYLSKEQVRSLLTESVVENAPKFDSLMTFLKIRQYQYAKMKVNEVPLLTEPIQEDFSKTNKKEKKKIDIETVNSDILQPSLNFSNYDEHNQPVGKEVNLTPYALKNHIDIHDEQSSSNINSELNILQLDDVSVEKVKMNLIKISPDGIERTSGDISEYDPLKINKNTYTNENIRLGESTARISNVNLGKNDSPTFSTIFEQELKGGIDEKRRLDTSEFDTAKQSFSSIDSYYGDNISEELTADVSYSSNMELLASTSVNLASYAKQLSNSSNSSSRTSSLQAARLNDTISTSTCSRRYLQLQDGFSSDSDGDFEIIDRLDKFPDNRITTLDKVQTQPTLNEQSDKCFSSDFNSEYDDFDDMIINKHVKMIINKLEEKDEQISRVVEQLDVITPSSSKEVKRGFVKKEITYPLGENSKSGVAKRTIFQRDKTEEFSTTPKNVIMLSENTCDKSKIASTKASYSETLGIKRKKQLDRMREEQYKKVANTISQTIRKFSNIFNLPDSNEEKSLRISRASLDFVYDLKKVNEVFDMEKKQNLLDDAYDKLCLSILGKNANNPKVQSKMKELMPILQEIAAPDQGNSDDASTKLLSQYIKKASFSKDVPKGKSQLGESRYVREDVQNLWINNIKGIERLFKRLGLEKFYFELTPDLFKTDHVVHMMNFIQANGPSIESFPLNDRCLPIDLPECFDTLKPYGSIMLVDD